ncbi:probable auxin efflux carrier component 9 [Ananas comosus]|uniref:Auxin efflux carrier component n=1 Tax=Ananas comosus TaxID=4615 RepID=A0A6P5FX73_ANACO|nr:probable auxin efflux carrier component 9 [Ananas comosus]
MISGSGLYAVAKAMAPLYFAMAVGYASVRWWRAFTPEQCAGLNHFVAVLAMPLLIFRMVAGNNPYAMTLRLLLADSLQKLLLLAALLAWALRRSRRDASHSSASSLSPLAWAVTMFSLATLPNTVIMGVPLLDGMYGASGGRHMVQIVFLQFAVWYNVVVFLYETIAAARSCAVAPLPRLEGDASTGTNVSISMPPPSEGNDNETVDPAPPTAPKEDAEIANVDVATYRLDVEAQEEEGAAVPPMPPPPAVKVVMVMAGKKLMKVPSTYASFLGLLWSLISFRCGIKMPTIVDDSLSVISITAVGLSMFSIGTFMARQTRFISCGYRMAIVSTLIRFLIGPITMGATSLVVGLHGTLLHIAIVQAALPLAVLSFVYAEEYKLHADIMSTGVIVGNFVSVPVTIVYYILLGL